MLGYESRHEHSPSQQRQSEVRREDEGPATNTSTTCHAHADVSFAHRNCQHADAAKVFLMHFFMNFFSFCISGQLADACRVYDSSSSPSSSFVNFRAHTHKICIDVNGMMR